MTARDDTVAAMVGGVHGSDDPNALVRALAERMLDAVPTPLLQRLATERRGQRMAEPPGGHRG